MAINLVRKPSETPNISNYDDYRMFRYATGGYNGVVERYGNECDYEINGFNFKIKSGELVVDGVQARIDANGVTITIDNVTGNEYYSIYCEIDLSLINNPKVEIKSTKNTVNYPVIDKGDDFTENQTGIARLELYRFVANSGVISQIHKIVKVVKLGQSLNSETSVLSDNAKNAVVENNGSYSSLKKDANNILKNNSEIIERKIEIYNGDAVNYVDVSSYNLVEGDIIEIGVEVKNYSDNHGIMIKRFKLKSYGSSRLLRQEISMPFFAPSASSGTIASLSMYVRNLYINVNSVNGIATTIYMTGRDIYYHFNEQSGTITGHIGIGVSIYKIIT